MIRVTIDIRNVREAKRIEKYKGKGNESSSLFSSIHVSFQGFNYPLRGACESVNL